MIRKILYIRYMQIRRSLQDLTLFHAIAGVLLLFFFVLSVLSKMTLSLEYTWVFTSILAFSLLFIQFNRPDKRLISIITEKPYVVFSVEYSVALIPFFIILIALKSFLALLALLIFVFCIAGINKGLYQSKGISHFSKLLPKSAFEWRAGMRKWGLTILLFYVLAVAVSGIRVAPFIFLFFGLSVMSQFFYQCEPLSILCLSNENARSFLLKKIGQSLFIYNVITVPVVVLSMVLVPDLWFVAPIFLLLANVNMANAVLIKYTFFHPNSSTGGGNILSNLSLLGCIIPFLAPVPLMMVGWYYFKAHKKLRYYLND